MEEKPNAHFHNHAEYNADATGSCFLSVKNFTKFVEYAPCRTGGLAVSDNFYGTVQYKLFYSESNITCCPL